MTRTVSAVGDTDRLHVLDVLRGIALLGMFLVHFAMFSSGGNAVDETYKRIVSLFFEERFWAMFAMLFGVGFAIQLRRAEARGGSFGPSFVRRMVALAAFGFIAHACFGFNVLLGYAVWGLPLLLVRRWSVRALIVAVVISAVSWNAYTIARVAYGVTTRGEQAVRAELESTAAANRVFNEANQKAQDARSYRTVVVARLQHMRWFYAQPFSFLPVNTFTLFLLGLLGLRLGFFDEPDRHRRAIVGLMAVGLASWAFGTWATLPAHTGGPILRDLVLNRLQYGFGLIRELWMAFAYMGVVLLLVARDPRWLGRLAMFGWTGRMALTNYMLQIAILDLTFAKYALGLSVTPLVGLAMALSLFVAGAMASRWWLARFRFGPLEWLWRSITYARWQPWRVSAPGDVLDEAAVGAPPHLAAS